MAGAKRQPEAAIQAAMEVEKTVMSDPAGHGSE